jgi:hypothetical protein
MLSTADLLLRFVHAVLYTMLLAMVTEKTRLDEYNQL